MTEEKDTVISVVIPAFGCSRTLGACLQGLFASDFRPFECIVVDDGSPDDLSALVKPFAVTLVRLPERHGPAYARNRGADVARGDILVFIDSDVKPRIDTLSRTAAFFAAHPDVSAVFGSYDDEPAEPGFFSQFKNLFHHYTHQVADTNARTFWAGCGAVRRDAFRKVGGFDERYTRPSVEDIELGYRLNRQGFAVRLEKRIQGTHLKQWTFRELLRSDIMDRALPWTELLLKEGRLANDLNIRVSARISAAGVLLGVMGMAAGLLHWMLAVCGGLLLVIVVLVNLPVYGFFMRKRGLWFAARAMPLHLFYLLYSGVTFPVAVLLYRMKILKAGGSNT
jgi:GT2 family glycosyltransferase